MKNFLALFLLFIAATGSGAGEGKVRAVGVGVVWEDVKESFGGFPVLNQQEPVSLALVVDSGGAGIIALNEDKSRIELLRDDTGKNLEPKLWPFPKIAEGGKEVMITVNGEKAPDARAEMIQVKGVLMLSTGSKSETKRSGLTPVKKGELVEVSPELSFKISDAGKPQWGDDPLMIELEIKRDIPEVAEVVFYDGEGKVIESRGAGSTRAGFLNKVTVSREFHLKRKVDQIAVEVKRWTDLAEKEVPFNLSLAIGGTR